MKLLEFPAVEKGPSDQDRVVMMLEDLIERAKAGEFTVGMFLGIDTEDDVAISTTAEDSITALGMLSMASKVF